MLDLRGQMYNLRLRNYDTLLWRSDELLQTLFAGLLVKESA